MEALVKLNSKLTVKIDFSNHLDLKEKLASYEEIFGIEICGACQSDNIRHVVREVTDPKNAKKTYKYYELHCQDCHARLAFGVKQDAETLFPKRKGEDGEYLKNGGWTKYQKPAE